jgi:hypothetical protein
MKAILTFLKTALFLVLCVVGWTVLPVLFLVGGLALLLHALVVESFLSFRGSKAPAPKQPESPVADGLCTTTRPPRSIAP